MGKPAPACPHGPRVHWALVWSSGGQGFADWLDEHVPSNLVGAKQRDLCLSQSDVTSGRAEQCHPQGLSVSELRGHSGRSLRSN